MVEVKRELKVSRVDYICDKCKKGFMVYDMPTDKGPKHQCSYCKAVQALDTQYPYMEYKEK